MNSEVKEDMAMAMLLSAWFKTSFTHPISLKKLSKLKNSSTEPWSCTEQEYFITSAVSEHPVDILEVVVLPA